MDAPRKSQIPGLILEGVENRSDEMAIKRIRMLVAYPCSDALNLLLRIMKDGDRSEEVKAAATEVVLEIIGKVDGAEGAGLVEDLSAFGNETVDYVIAKIIRDESFAMEVRMKAAECFDLCRGESARDRLGLIMRDTGVPAETKVLLVKNVSPDTACELLEALRLSADPNKYRMLCQLSGEGVKDVKLRSKAMEELASCGDERAIGLFTGALHDEDSVIRHQAVIGLTRLWTDDPENAVEALLAGHLGVEKDAEICTEIVGWMGMNAYHSVSKTALSGVAEKHPDDAYLANIAEEAVLELERRLEARPARFRSGPGVLNRPTLPPDEVGMPTIDADVPEENRKSQPRLSGAAPRRSDLRELTVKLMSTNVIVRDEAADSLAVIAAVTRDRRELKLIESVLAGRGDEFAYHLMEVRKKLGRMPLPDEEKKAMSRPSRRPTPVSGLHQANIPPEARKTPR